MIQKDRDYLTKKYGNAFSFEGNVTIISETEYKKFTKLVNKKYIDINENEYLLLANIDIVVDSYKNHYENKTPINVNGKKLTPASDKIINTAIENGAGASNDGIVVVTDELIKGLDMISVSCVGNFINNKQSDKTEDNFEKLIVKSGVAHDYRTRTKMEASTLGLKTMAIFIGLYLGITFAISSATILAIGQLSESSDNKKRYKVLTQIGADQKMINKSLFIGIAITFLFPLVIALIHAYFGLKEINSLLVTLGSFDLTSNILLTTLFMLVVYGGYFLLTYYCSKNLIKEK